MDTAGAVAAVTLALFTWTLTAGHTFTWAFVVDRAWWYLAVPIWVVALSPTRHPSIALDLRHLLRGLVHASAVLFVAYLGAYFYAGPDVLPRLVALYILWNGLWLTLGGRLVLLWTLTRDSFTRRILIVGEGTAVADARRLISTWPGVQVLETADDADAAREPIVELAQRLQATEIVVTESADASRAHAGELLRCRELGLLVITFEQLYEQTLRRIPVRHVGHLWLLVELFGGNGLTGASPLAKRLLDVAVATVLLIVGAPLAVIAAMAILIESGRPVLYRQARLGRGGRPFDLVKFRTMAVDAEAAGPQWSPEDDPRVTRVGRWLRRTHLDELPNAWAVLRGDMSMVGPRPERPEFVSELERHVPWYRARLTAAPGITGWAQVNHDYTDSIEDSVVKLEYDLYYIRHQSLWFDLSVLAQTVGRVLGFRGR
jgi:exopolysaccharide biosynthesis polyprenyl glycosylphosphotransferase